MLESLHSVSSGYLDGQEVTRLARRTLLNWLVEVAQALKNGSNSSEALFLAAHYIDRFLTKVSVSTQKLQLLGVTCLHIGASHASPRRRDDHLHVAR